MSQGCQDLLSLDDVHSYYGLAHVLHGVSVVIGRGEAVAVLGRNGSGKTTIVNSILGLAEVRKGRITFDGEDLIGLPIHTIARKGIALVPSGRQIFPGLDVMQHLRVPVSSKSKSRSELLEKCFYIFPELKDRLKQKAKSLSGGEQQMLVIARALMMDPQLLLLDEPMEGLAPIAVGRVAAAVKMILQEGITVLLCETQVRRAAQIAERAYVLATGRVIGVYEGGGDDLGIPQEVQEKYLGVGR